MNNRVGRPEPVGPNLAALVFALATALFVGSPLILLLWWASR